MLALTGLITAGFFFFSSEKEEVIENTPNETKTISSIVENEEPKLQLLDTAKTPIQVNELKQDLSSQPQILASELVRLKETWPTYSQRDNSYKFPSLTEEEIEAVKVQKIEMVKRAQKGESYKDLARLIYRNINDRPEGAGSFKRGKISKVEVSNLEYRTFLFDLLIQDKKEEFLAAKPNQAAWHEKPGDNMDSYVDLYFSAPAYNSYPVVNITPQGAKMYCQWFSDLLNQNSDLDQQLFSKSLYEVSLPTFGQWRAAALWVTDDSLPFLDGDVNAHALSAEYPENSASLQGNWEITTHVAGFMPINDTWHLFGNAAEIISEKDHYSAIGGSWEDSLEDLKIKNRIHLSDDFEGVRSIGFRVVLNDYTTWYLADENEIPVLNKKEIKELEERKKELVERSVNQVASPPSVPHGSSMFKMSKEELTNGDYKLFLFDLIQNGKLDEYRKWAPNQKLWNDLGGFVEPMTQQYFSHPAYDKYPLVNVSIDGIQAYCKWLTQLVIENGKSMKFNEYEFALPNKDYWLEALKDGHYWLESTKDMSMPWSDDDLAPYFINYNNFSELKPYGPNPEKNFSSELQEKAKKAGFKKPVIALFCALVSTGIENGRGFRNLLGNVSEVVVTKDGYEVIGGSYLDTLEEIKRIPSFKIDENFKGSATVGYRIGLRPKILNTSNSEEYRFPSITQEERELIKKVKKSLIKEVSFKEKNTGGPLNGQFLADESDISVDRIKEDKYRKIKLKSTEVTNVEYRAFLFDLLVQGKEEDFLKAKPNQNLWLTLQEEPFNFGPMDNVVTQYFAHPVYDDYPVVNISLEGMQLFCEWYEELIQKELGSTKYYAKDDIYKVEIPDEGLWRSRALKSDTNHVFKSRFEELNYRHSLYLPKSEKQEEPYLPIYPSPFNWEPEATHSLPQDENGYYSLYGNVSEMVINNGKYYTKGGSWLGIIEEIDANYKAPFDPKSEGSPAVGFRPSIGLLIENFVKESNEIPQLSEYQIEETKKRKEAYIKDILNEKRVSFIPLGATRIPTREKVISVGSFLMSTNEVSGSEYITFLYDLIIQGREEDFLKAKPKSDNWSKLDYESFYKFYFGTYSSIKYSIGSITPEGAKMYCQWLADEIQKADNEKKWEVRLPTKDEWIYANAGGKERYPLALDTNFYQTTSTDGKSQYQIYNLETQNYGAKNEFGLYHLGYNLREMVQIGDKVGFAGGGSLMGADYMFMTTKEKQMVEDLSRFHYDQYEISESDLDYRANVGFRIVIPYESVIEGYPKKIKATFK